MEKKRVEIETDTFACPYCGAELNKMTNVIGEGDAPRPRAGDTSLCASCSGVLVITDEAGHTRVPSDEEREAWPEGLKQVHARAKELLGKARDSAAERKYISQIHRIYQALKKWNAEHPGANAIVQYNFPSNFGFIATLKQAISAHALTFGGDGLEMVKACCDLEEHTVIMLQVALERIANEKA